MSSTTKTLEAKKNLCFKVDPDLALAVAFSAQTKGVSITKFLTEAAIRHIVRTERRLDREEQRDFVYLGVVQQAKG